MNYSHLHNPTNNTQKRKDQFHKFIHQEKLENLDSDKRQRDAACGGTITHCGRDIFGRSTRPLIFEADLQKRKLLSTTS